MGTPRTEMLLEADGSEKSLSRHGIDFLVTIYTTLLTPFNKYLLSPYSVPGTILEVRDISLRKTNQGRGGDAPCPCD